MAQETKSYKDYFGRSAAKALAVQVAGVHPKFDSQGFIKTSTRGLGELELADRIRQFSAALRQFLPESVPRSLGILTDSLPPILPEADSMTGGWLQWPMGQFIADYGLPHFNESMVAMIELTQRFTSEFAVRPFVEERPKETFAALKNLTDHSSQHVRRWCSEGTRPLLPWGKKLHALVKNPKPIWPILEALKDDPERYVVRSVANNLNDIAKNHPDDVVARCRRWRKKSGEGREWLVKHGLRTLIKKGDPGALELLGFGSAKGITATLSLSPKSISIGGALQMVAVVESTSKAPTPLMVDFVVHYVRKRGESTPKVFKWTSCELEPGERREFSKKLSLKVTTVRALYPGAHRVELQINGVRKGEARFILR